MSMPQDDGHVLTVEVSEDLYAAVQQAAAANGRSPDEEARAAVIAHFGSGDGVPHSPPNTDPENDEGTT